MVPPGDIGALPIWVGVFVLLGLALAVFNYAFYTRVVRLVLQGKGTARFDQPLKRLNGALMISLGQQKVLQRVRYGDFAGMGLGVFRVRDVESEDYDQRQEQQQPGTGQ